MTDKDIALRLDRIDERLKNQGEVIDRLANLLRDLMNVVRDVVDKQDSSDAEQWKDEEDQI